MPQQEIRMRPRHTQRESHKQGGQSVYTREATGLLLIAGVLLVLTLVRDWHHIHWSLR